MRANEIKNETDETQKWDEKLKPKNSKYEIKKYSYDFRQYEATKSFGESIYTHKAEIVEAEEEQSNLFKI